MPISENVAQALQRYKTARDLSISELSDELGIAKFIAVSYLNGTGNPRADTLDLLARKLNIPLTEIVSGPRPGREQAETIVRAANLFSGLSPERQERGVQLFLELTALFSEEDRT